MKKHHVMLLSLSALAWGAPPALADARDDVLANTARCGQIADPRNWLDCYYGAAQPMRTQLGLPSAPAAQIRLVPGGATAFAPAMAPAMAGSAMIAPQQQPAGPPPMAQKPRSGGFLTDILGGVVVVKNIRATDYSFDRKGMFTITLSNGEVWQQLEDDSTVAQWRVPANRLVVQIKTGALNSNNLEVTGDNRLYKVQRVR